MSDFKEVSINRAANVYFDGKVVSRTITFKDDSFKTLGVMQAGDYRFDTKEAELMEITAGKPLARWTSTVTSGDSKPTRARL